VNALRRAALVVAATVLLPVAARAQSCNAISIFGLFWFPCNVTTTANLTINAVMQLTLSTTATTLTPPTAANYNAGFVADVGPTATVRANTGWHLQISSSAATWTAAGVGARVNKPAGDLTWSLAAGGPFSGLSTSVAAVTNAGATAGTATNIFYRTLYSYATDTPGTYKLTVVFTLTSP
jgi:hypothetical protein